MNNQYRFTNIPVLPKKCVLSYMVRGCNKHNHNITLKGYNKGEGKNKKKIKTKDNNELIAVYYLIRAL